MPSKKKKYNARFPAGRIKKIMQSDEEVGKVAQAVPVIISRTLELFVDSLLTKTLRITNSRNAKTLSPSHMKQCIMEEQRFDFLRELVKNVPDVCAADECGPITFDEEEDQSSTEMPPPPPVNLTTKKVVTETNANQGQRATLELEGTNIGYEVSLPSTSTQAQHLHIQQKKISTINRNVMNGDGYHLEVVEETRYLPPVAASTKQNEEHLGQLSEKKSYSFKQIQSVKAIEPLRLDAERLLDFCPDEKKKKLSNNISHINYTNNNKSSISSNNSTMKEENLRSISSPPPTYESTQLNPAPIIKMDYSAKPIIKIDYSEIAFPSTLMDTYDGSDLVNNIADHNSLSTLISTPRTMNVDVSKPINRSKRRVDHSDLMITTDVIEAAIADPAREELNLDLRPDKNIFPNITNTIISKNSIAHSHGVKVNSNLKELDEDYDD